MQRNHYTPEFISLLSRLAPSYSLDELLPIAQSVHPTITKEQLLSLLSKRKIHYKGYNPKHNHPANALPLLSEYIKPDGMTLIKVAPDKWTYKQRYIYEKHYGPLPPHSMVIFLDGDRSNFDPQNLRAVSTPVYNTAKNKHLLSNNQDISSAALDLAELYQLLSHEYKLDRKDKQNESLH